MVVEPDNFAPITPPVTTNWLAIAAPDYSREQMLKYRAGANSGDSVEERDTKWMSEELQDLRSNAFHDLFRTAHAGFSMAKKCAGSRPLTVHTGPLGCGVFKNSVTLSTAAQLLAAKIVGVDSLHFYDVDNAANNAVKFDSIKEIVDTETQPAAHNRTVRDVLESVLTALSTKARTRAAP